MVKKGIVTSALVSLKSLAKTSNQDSAADLLTFVEGLQITQYSNAAQTMANKICIPCWFTYCFCEHSNPLSRKWIIRIGHLRYIHLHAFSLLELPTKPRLPIGLRLASVTMNDNYVLLHSLMITFQPNRT